MFTSFNQTLTRTVVGTVGTLLFGGLCLFGATAPAVAAPAETRTATVRYADLDVGNARGRATLDRRIRSAARIVCASGDTGFIARAAESRCIREAYRTAAAKVA